MPATRQRDHVTIETERGSFDRFSAVQIVNDLDAQSEATLELGDDGMRDIYDIVQPGQLFSIRLNGRLRLTGRAEINRIPGDSNSGVKLHLTVRTKLADARYCSADPKIKVEKATIKQFILQLYAKLGYVESDFVFNIGSDRDLMTGTVAGHKSPKDISPIKPDQLKVNPTDTIFSAAERQLKRLHVQQWDAADGRIVIGSPDDDQPPTYRFQCRRGDRREGNNVCGFEHTKDWSDIPSELSVYGKKQTDDGAGNVNFEDVKGISRDPDLIAVYNRNKHFFRPVLLTNEWAKDIDAVTAIADRERSLRSRQKDAWTISLDGWSFWNGSSQIPYVHDTTADVDILGGPQGRYLVHRVGLGLSSQGLTTMVGLVAQGIWAI